MITEHTFRRPVVASPDEPTPEVRSVDWRGEAADEEAARQAGWRAWDAKYGASRQPVSALVEVTPVVA